MPGPETVEVSLPALLINNSRAVVTPQPVILIGPNGEVQEITVTLEPGDVQIGAIEIKDGSSDVRAAVGGGLAANALRTVTPTDDPLLTILGATSGAAVTTDANGTLQQYLRGLLARGYGSTFLRRPTFAVSTSAHANNNDVIGGKITVSDVARVAAGSGLIHRWSIRSILNINADTVLHIFDSDPTASTITSNTPLVIHENDRTKLLKSITIPTASWKATQGMSPWRTIDVVGPGSLLGDTLGFQLASGADIYAAWEMPTAGSLTFAATDDAMHVVAGFRD